MRLLIAISTFGNRLTDVAKVLLPENTNIDYLVVHQKGDGAVSNDIFSNRYDVKYIASDTKGVAFSRNIAIEFFLRSDCDLILFMDDDVELVGNIHELIMREFIIREQASAMAFQIGNISNKRKLIRNYPTSNRTITRIGALKVGTIELVCKKQFLTNYDDCRFPVNLGAGTDLPNCDEPVFISRLLKHGAVIFFVPLTIGYHPKLSSGTLFTHKGQFICRGVAFREIFGTFWAPFLILAFYIKNRKNFLKFKGFSLVYLFKGFWKSKEYLDE